MSDLSAANCGCGSNNPCDNNNGNNSCNYLWLILLFSCFGGNNMGGCGNICGDNCGHNNNCCDMLIWILLLSCFCGNGNGNGCFF